MAAEFCSDFVVAVVETCFDFDFVVVVEVLLGFDFVAVVEACFGFVVVVYLVFELFAVLVSVQQALKLQSALPVLVMLAGFPALKLLSALQALGLPFAATGSSTLVLLASLAV